MPVSLHPEVEVSVTVNVARNADEAERQARGEDVTVRREAAEEAAEPVAAEAFFEQPQAVEGADESPPPQGKGAENVG